VLTQLKADFPDTLRVAYRHYPLVSIHPNASLASQASEAAGLQGEFWPFHDALYERQGEWSALSDQAFEDWLVALAEELGLDADSFSEDLRSPAVVALVDQARAAADELGLPGTPFLVINDRPYGGPLDYDNLSAIVQLFRLRERQFSRCPEMTIDPAIEYLARIETAKGEIIVKLFPETAPLAVNSFVFLAREGWFDGVTFHRVLPGFVAQAGDPSGTGFGGPGYAFQNETDPDLTFDREGLVAMANAGPDSNGSQFFITFDKQPDLDGGYTIFGEVITGMEVARELTPRNPQTGPSLPPGDEILQITIEER
jgi:cyclophilin family peptidyl-prolyl cis-trans isomerase